VGDTPKVSLRPQLNAQLLVADLDSAALVAFRAIETPRIPVIVSTPDRDARGGEP
jgi:hypothetical protein